MGPEEKFQRMVEENRQQYQRGIKLLAELIYKKVQESGGSSPTFVAQNIPVVIKVDEEIHR